MKTTVCFTAKNIYYLKGGGHFWVPLNWSLGLRALGCEVIWLEPIDPKTPVEEVWTLTKSLKKRLEPYGLRDSIALSSITGEPLDPAALKGCLDIVAASELTTLLINLRYDLPADQVRRFHRSALLDIDPGLLQMWIAVGRSSGLLDRHLRWPGAMPRRERQLRDHPRWTRRDGQLRYVHRSSDVRRRRHGEPVRMHDVPSGKAAFNGPLHTAGTPSWIRWCNISARWREKRMAAITGTDMPRKGMRDERRYSLSSFIPHPSSLIPTVIPHPF